MSYGTIHVSLLNEGTKVWRPVWAKHLEGDRFKLPEFAPDHEEWEFPPGTVVRVQLQLRDETVVLVAIAQV